MQRPRLTERTVEALGTAANMLACDYEVMWGDKSQPKREVENLNRAIEYLEDLLRWHKAKQAQYRRD